MGMFPFLLKVVLFILGVWLALLAFIVLLHGPLVWFLNKLFGKERASKDFHGPNS